MELQISSNYIEFKPEPPLGQPNVKVDRVCVNINDVKEIYTFKVDDMEYIAINTTKGAWSIRSDYERFDKLKTFCEEKILVLN